MQLGFLSSDSLRGFPKLLKAFGTYDMDDCKYNSSVNSINFGESSKRYANSHFMRKSDNLGNNFL